MKRHPELNGLRGCQGQAATEFTVAATFVLVPLFLLIPLVGKYIDIKQTSVQQARFEAWEYTAWFGEDSQDADLADDLKSDERAGRRNFSTTRSKGNQLFFSDITAPDYKDRTAPGQTPPAFELNPLWVDHHGNTLFHQGTPNSEVNDIPTPDPTPSNLIDKLVSLINLVTNAFGQIMNKSHLNRDADFNILRTKGYFTSTFKVDVRTSREVVPDLSNPTSDPTEPLVVSAKASVLARGWNAGSTANASSESKGLVLTSLLAKPSEWFNDVVNGLQRVINVAKHVMPIDITLPHGPEFGHMEDDLMPYEHLVGDARKTKENNGLYYYSEK